jgi:GGDEF domain-containing protein
LLAEVGGAADDPRVSDRRVLGGVTLGVTGFVLGVLGVVFDSAIPGVIAGAAALGTAWVVTLPRPRVEVAPPVATPVTSGLAEPEPEPEPELEPASHGGVSPQTIAEIEALDALDPADGDTLTDPLTGLLDERYFRVALEARISAARRHLRPVAVVLVEVVEGLQEGTVRSADPTMVASGVVKTLREADTACRLADGRFGLLLEDTPENGAVWTVERLRRTLIPEHPGVTMWAGVACYPSHAFTSAELHDRASRALDAAREWRQDRIEVATAD